MKVAIAGLVAVVQLGPSAGCSEIACPSCDAPEKSGAVENPALLEISGIAASSRFPDVIYAHNDSSDSSRFFALSTSGADLATYLVEDAQNDDWEDVARARCASGDCLYMADIGDNDLLRTSYSIYIIDEPASVEPGEHMLPSQRVTFEYPNGPHDAEVLLVHPLTGLVTIVTKEADGPASIYELDALVPDAMLSAVGRGHFEPPKGSSKFTGGAIHPDATGILLRTKTRLFYYPMDPEQTAAAALRGEACQLELADEAQGEAVTWLSSGEGLITIGEGLNAAVNISACGA